MKGDFMITTESSAAVAQERLRTILREALDRLNNELMDDEEQQLLLDRIKRLRRKLEIQA